MGGPAAVGAAGALLDPHALFYMFKKTLLMKWPAYFPEVVLFIYCIGAVMKVKPIKGYSWFHHLVLVFLTGFAGGIITPMFLGKPPVLFQNDLVIPFTCMAWYLVHHTHFEKLLAIKQIKYPILIFYEINRANGVMKTVSAANAAIPPSYGVTPIIGPIFIGTLYGSLGAFLPFDRGLAYIQEGVPQNMEVAFIGSALYHFAVYDPTLLGAYLRGLPFLHLSNPDNVKLLVVVFFIVMALTAYHFHVDPLEPIHAILYQLSGLPTPATAAALKKSKSIDDKANGGKAGATPPRKPAVEEPNKTANLSRILVPVLAVAVNLFFSLPKTDLGVGQLLTSKDYIASCGALDLVTRGCQQHFLTMDEEGKLAVYRGSSPKDAAKERVWTSKNKKAKGKLDAAGYYSVLSPTGQLEVRHKDSGDTVYWATTVGKKATGTGRFAVRVSPKGGMGVFNHTAPVWLSDSK